MKRFAFKPKEIKALVEGESKWDKLKIALWSIFLGSFAGVIGRFFDGMVYRSGQMQGLLWGGAVEPVGFISPNSNAMFNLRNDLDVLNAKSIKDLKYLGESWESLDYSYSVNGNTVRAGPNRDPSVNSHYFTQSQQFTSEYVNYADPDNRDLIAEAYDQWKEMTEDVIFFDTGACLLGGHIGNANEQTFGATSSRFVDWGTRTPTPEQQFATRTNDQGWWIDTAENPSQVQYNSDRTLQATSRSNAFDTRLGAEGRVRLYDEDQDLYRWLLEDYINMVDECDIECQKKGSQLSVIASLMGLIYGLVGLNSLFMFVGTWRGNWRVCSVYCTMCVCVFTFILLIVVATMLFTPYNAICSRSMYPAWGEAIPYYMFDDFYWTYSLFIASWILMFVFVCIGMCQNVHRKM